MYKVFLKIRMFAIVFVLIFFMVVNMKKEGVKEEINILSIKENLYFNYDKSKEFEISLMINQKNSILAYKECNEFYLKNDVLYEELTCISAKIVNEEEILNDIYVRYTLRFLLPNINENISIINAKLCINNALFYKEVIIGNMYISTTKLNTLKYLDCYGIYSETGTKRLKYIAILLDYEQIDQIEEVYIGNKKCEYTFELYEEENYCLIKVSDFEYVKDIYIVLKKDSKYYGSENLRLDYSILDINQNINNIVIN